MRGYVPQRVSARAGMSAISATPFTELTVHSIRRLNDATQGTSKRIYGSGTKLFVGEGTAAVDSGYSGNPLSLFSFQPEQSVQPWMYVTDSVRMRKVRIDGLVHTIGMEPPLKSPTVSFGPDVFLAVSAFGAVGAWVPSGTAGALAEVARANTTITKILYDTGTTGWASVQPASITGFGKGMLLTINSGGGTAEQILVQEVRQAFPATTIGSIAYDAGTTGLCTIQPVAATVAASNSGSGSSPRNPPFIQAIHSVRRQGSHVPITPPHTPPIIIGTIPRDPSTQPVGLQPDMLIRLNSGGGNDEFVRVLSVSIGPNNQASFRCSTVNTHVAAETLAGVSSFRGYFTKNHAAAETLTDGSISSAIASGIGSMQIVSGFNLTTAPPNPIQETDEVHVSLFMDHPGNLSEAKIFFDVGDASFTQNYFYASLRQSDMQQASLSNLTALLARQQALTRIMTQGFGRGRGIRALGGGDNSIDLPDSGDEGVPFASGGPVVNSMQASTGDSQWTEFRFKVSDLTRVGADMTKTLGNVTAIRIQFQTSATLNVQVGDLWIGGTYGPDIGSIGSPIFYRFRGRSKITGVKSLAGPATRSGIEPHNQQISVTGAIHPNASCDTIDVFRWGATLPQWTYVGSTTNIANWIFLDDLSDIDIAVNPLLDVDLFQPFPDIDLPRSGVVNVAGTKVTYVSGDTFNSAWYPGTQISINGTYFTLYAQPPGDGTLETVENASTLANVPYFLNQATLLGQPLPAFWGPYSEGSAAFFFACGSKLQPGVLFLLNGNNPDASSDTLQTIITQASEPLMNGCMYDGNPFVWSSDRLFRLTPNLGSLGPLGLQLFIPYEVAGKTGLFSRWAFCVGDLIYYLGKDGIYVSNGSSSQSITNTDLYLLFPHDGQPGQSVTIGSITFFPPDMTQTAKLRLSYIDQHVYFDYVDTSGAQRTMVYNTFANIWGVDDYTPTVLTHYADEGDGAHAMILGGTDGKAYLSGGVTDGTGIAFPCEMRMSQMSELPGGYEMPYDAFLGLQGSQAGNVSLVLNVDGVDYPVSVPVTTSYGRNYVRSQPVKGKILASALTASFPFSVFLRDCQIRCGAWGRDGEATPVNPFSSLRRAQTPKVP